MRRPSDTAAVAAVAALLSVASLAYFWHAGRILLYGDAVAHIAIARRTFDSLTPGLKQLGTVWLPLPHLLMIPFLLPAAWWQSGVGGSVPSMVSYLAATVGVFRLVRPLGGRLAAWLSALLFALNPNLLYMQSTAMTEPLFFATLVWTVVFLADFLRALHGGRPRAAAWPLVWTGVALACAVLTRYDGWVLAVAAACVVAGAQRGRALREPALRPALAVFVLLTAAAPGLWLAQNYRLSGDVLDFARGPYSAKAIEQRTARPGAPKYPGYGSPPVAGLYFVKAAKLNMGDGRWGDCLLLLAAMGAAALLAVRRDAVVLLLLWLPLPFYAWSVAYGSVPIFVPPWWPHSYYNVRYGLELLPAFAVFVPLCGLWLKALPTARRAFAAGLAFSAMAGYAVATFRTPLCLREAIANGTARFAIDAELASRIRELPPDARILMYASAHPGALERAGRPFRDVVQEGNYRLWPQALDDPSTVDYAIAFRGDPVDAAVRAHPSGMLEVDRLGVPDQPEVTVYRSARRLVGAARR